MAAAKAAYFMATALASGTGSAGPFALPTRAQAIAHRSVYIDRAIVNVARKAGIDRRDAGHVRDGR